MARHILKCETCNEYTISDHCPKCGVKSSEIKPPKYSPEDKYAKYRRQYKEQEAVEE